mmetsp:Transcript_107439/g.334927  ORF Transcript_107439/g.334927 Transcript_107439/m.334927 type:complete len:255 (-) Transcript_107439:762-1526(-)
MHPARREEDVEGRAAKEAPVDPGLLAPISPLAVQISAVLLAAIEAEVVLRGGPLASLGRQGRARADVPRLPVDLPVQVGGHAVGAPKAVEACPRRHPLRASVALLHLRQYGLGLLPRPLLDLLPPGARGQARLAPGIGVLAGALQPLQERPGDVAGPGLGLRREGLVAADLLQGELAVPAQPGELRPHVGPPSLAEGVALPRGHEVGGKGAAQVALPAHAARGLVAVRHDVPARVQLGKDARQWPQHQEVRVHV